MLRFSVTYSKGGVVQSFENRVPAALRALESAILASCEPFVPYNTGNLCHSGHSSGDGKNGGVTYSADYASECYYANREFNRRKHPQACAYWFEAAKAVDCAKWIEIVGTALGGQ